MREPRALPRGLPWGRPGEVFSRLAGDWRLDRSIEGHGTMIGEAAFTPAGDRRLHYREQGTLRLAGGAAFEAEREYLYAPRERGFCVFFKENPPRLFHEITLARVTDEEFAGEADHPCGQDHYRSFYRFLADGRFIIRHIVRGPRKDYTMLTSYARASR